MPDTERYARWVALLAASDAVLVQLFVIAAAGVLVWEVLRAAPEPWRAHGRRAFVALTLGVALTTLAGVVSTWALVSVAAGLGLVGAGVGRYMRGRRSAPTIKAEGITK